MAVNYGGRLTGATSSFVYTTANRFLVALLRSPFHGLLSKSVLVLSFKGRKSGAEYRLPVGYAEDGNDLQLLSNHTWWKNLSGGNVPVTVWIKGKEHHALADVVRDEETVANAILTSAKKTPTILKVYNIEVDSNGQPLPESVHQAARKSALIRLHLI
jgi:hypothetical protein